MNKPNLTIQDLDNSHNNLVLNSLNTEDELSGLTFHNMAFQLNEKPFVILGGSIHYFRIHPDYWYDRLLKLKYSGLNTVTCYIPWNLHQPCPECDFKFSGFLNVKKFFRMAYDIGLFVIVRPGPYICAELDFGGLPSWLLSESNVTLRSTFSYSYLKAVDVYFAALLGEIGDMQYSQALGGSIIAFQVENEYGSYFSMENENIDDAANYMKFVKDTLQKYGANEFLFTSDGTDLYLSGRVNSLNRKTNLFGAVNFQKEPLKALAALRSYQPSKPAFVAEYWGGWFDHWSSTKTHATLNISQFSHNLELVIQQGASFNIYMFHGGTNFGFTNGANVIDISKELPISSAPGDKFIYAATTTSYDYDAAVSENGDLTDKYFAIRRLIKNYQYLFPPGSVLVKLPPPQPNIPTLKYGEILVEQFMDFNTLLQYIQEPIKTDRVMYVEELMKAIYDGKFEISRALRKGSRSNVKKKPFSLINLISGFGYVLYRPDLSQFPFNVQSRGGNPGLKLRIECGVRDRGDIYWENQLISTIHVNQPPNQTIHFLQPKVILLI